MRNVCYGRLREGCSIMLHRTEFPQSKVPSWSVNLKSTVALLYTGHVVGNGFILCPENTDYRFLGDEWYGGPCLCTQNSDIGYTLRSSVKFNAACCVMRLDIWQRLWVPYVFLVPQGFVWELSAALSQHRVICVRKIKFRHVIEPMPSHYARAEMNFEPAEMLMQLARLQLSYSNYVQRGILDRGLANYYGLGTLSQESESTP
jgi:hypothetical protein